VRSRDQLDPVLRTKLFTHVAAEQVPGASRAGGGKRKSQSRAPVFRASRWMDKQSPGLEVKQRTCRVSGFGKESEDVGGTFPLYCTRRGTQSRSRVDGRRAGNETHLNPHPATSSGSDLRS
jgi:hypothetical protein